MNLGIGFTIFSLEMFQKGNKWGLSIIQFFNKPVFENSRYKNPGKCIHNLLKNSHPWHGYKSINSQPNQWR